MNRKVKQLYEVAYSPERTEELEALQKAVLAKCFTPTKDGSLGRWRGGKVEFSEYDVRVLLAAGGWGTGLDCWIIDALGLDRSGEITGFPIPEKPDDLTDDEYREALSEARQYVWDGAQEEFGEMVREEAHECFTEYFEGTCAHIRKNKQQAA